jgi:hypothetical protein
MFSASHGVKSCASWAHASRTLAGVSGAIVGWVVIDLLPIRMVIYQYRAKWLSTAGSSSVAEGLIAQAGIF